MPSDHCKATYDLDNGWAGTYALSCDQPASHPGLNHHHPAGFWWSVCDLEHEHPEKITQF